MAIEKVAIELPDLVLSDSAVFAALHEKPALINPAPSPSVHRGASASSCQTPGSSRKIPALVPPDPPRLQASLFSGWDRAVRTSLAADLGREFVDLVLPLLPESAPEFLRLVAGHRGYNEVWLLSEHAPLLWRRARAEFLARVDAVRPMISPVELFADIARDAPPDEREELRARAMAALAREEDPQRRGRALLDWAPFEAPDRRAAMVAEALAIATSSSVGLAKAIVVRSADRFDAAQRAVLRAIARRPDAGADGASLLVTLAQVAPPDEAIADARAALDQRRRAARDEIRFTVCALLDVVPFEVLRPSVEAWLRAVDGRRNLCFAAERLAPRAPPDILDLILERADAIRVEIWARAQILADVARHHPTRREALRAEVCAAVGRVVGDRTLGHRMAPEDVPEGANPVVLQARAVAGAGALLGSDAGDLQRIVLSRIAEMPSDFDDRHGLDAIPWEELGAALDPAVRAEAVRTVLSLRHRPSALKALGQMVAQFPAEARHLGLDGLSRLADATPPEAMERVLRALGRTPNAKTPGAPAPLPTRGAPAGDTSSAWTAADERSLAALTRYLTTAAYPMPDPLRKLVRALTPAAAARASEPVLAVQWPSQRVVAMVALASAPQLARRAREELLAAALVLIGSERHIVFDAPELSQAISEVCADGDLRWAERVAGFFDALESEREPYLHVVEAFAPLLRQLGGPEMITALVSKLRAPLPTPEFARPWAFAARGTFDA